MSKFQIVEHQGRLYLRVNNAQSWNWTMDYLISDEEIQELRRSMLSPVPASESSSTRLTQEPLARTEIQATLNTEPESFYETK